MAIDTDHKKERKRRKYEAARLKEEIEISNRLIVKLLDSIQWLLVAVVRSLGERWTETRMSAL